MMGILSLFLFGLLLSVLGFIAYVKIPKMSNSDILKSNDLALVQWINTGRYHNFKGYSVYFKDSLGDVLKNSQNDDTKTNIADLLERPVVLLIHGFPTFSFDFSEIDAELNAENYHVVAVDMLGFGLSDKPHDVNYGYSFQADVFQSVLNAVFEERDAYRTLLSSNEELSNDGSGLESRIYKEKSRFYHILAHDLGASVAQELIARQLDHQNNHQNNPHLNVENTAGKATTIKSVVLLNGGLFPEVHQKTTGQALIESPYTGPLLQLLAIKKTFSDGLAHVFGFNTKPSSDFLDIAWNALIYKDGIFILHKLQQYIKERRNNRERLVNALVEGSKSIPIRFINGPADPVSGLHMAKRFQELVPAERCDVVVLPDHIGHYPQIEAPAEVKRFVLEFFAKHYN